MLHDLQHLSVISCHEDIPRELSQWPQEITMSNHYKGVPIMLADLQVMYYRLATPTIYCVENDTCVWFRTFIRGNISLQMSVPVLTITMKQLVSDYFL